MNTVFNPAKLKVEFKSPQPIYQGFYQLQKLNYRHELFAGGWSQWLSAENIQRQDASVILLYDETIDAVILVEQLRVGLLMQDVASVCLLECAAGLIDAGETPEMAAEREAYEETGAKVTRLEKIAEFYTTPGGFSEKSHVFVGWTDASKAAELGGLASEDEEIKVHILDRPSITQMVLNGELITGASTLIALQWLNSQITTGGLK